MELGVIGVTYLDTPIAILNTVTISDTRKLELYARVQDEMDAACVILSTCNRTEIYYTAASPGIHGRMRGFFTGLFPAAEGCLIEKRGKEVLLYLFRVACGLQSLVVGEDQVLGQVTAAYEFAARQQTDNKVLNKVFLGAVTAAKKIKASLNISGIPLSISYIGIKLLEESCGIKGRSALVIGAGRMSRLAVEYLLDYGAAEVTVCNRTLRGGFEGLEDKRIRFDSFATRYARMEGADIVVSATSAPHEVITRREMAARARPLYLLDLALPFDVQPEVRGLENVTLYNMHTLKAISEANRKKREALCDQAEGLIVQMADELGDQLARLKADPVIEHIAAQCGAATRDCMGFILSKLTLSEREAAVIEKAVASYNKKLVRGPIHALKRLRASEVDDYVAMAEYLFDMDAQQK